MKRLTRTAGLAAGITSIVMIGSTAAFAAGTVVTVGGVGTAADVPVSGTNTSDVSFETNFGVPMTCADSDIDGTVARGAAVSVGNTVGTIDTLTLSNCLATSLDFPVTATMAAQDITVRADADAGDPIAVDIQVDAVVAGTGCNFTATGSVRGVINPGSGSPDGTIDLQGGLDLLIDTAGGSSSGSSCGGEVFAGDLAEATGGNFDLVTSGANAGPINHS